MNLYVWILAIFAAFGGFMFGYDIGWVVIQASIRRVFTSDCTGFGGIVHTYLSMWLENITFDFARV